MEKMKKNKLKYIFSLLLLSVFVFGKDIIYPFEFSFDDNGMIAHSISIKKFENNNFSKEIILLDNEDNYLLISNVFFNIQSSVCKPIKNLDDLNYYENIKNKKSSCSNLFAMCGKKEKKNIEIDGFKIITYKNKLEATAFIFKDENFIALIAGNIKAEKFDRILHSIHYNHSYDKNNTDYYIKKVKEMINEGKVNSATEYLYSVMLLDHENAEVKNISKKLYDLKLRQIKSTNYKPPKI
jgi:hypothetical protein